MVASQIQESLEAQQFVQFYDEAAILKGWSAGHHVGIVRVGVHHEQLAARLILPPEAKVRCHGRAVRRVLDQSRHEHSWRHGVGGAGTYHLHGRG